MSKLPCHGATLSRSCSYCPTNFQGEALEQTIMKHLEYHHPKLRSQMRSIADLQPDGFRVIYTKNGVKKLIPRKKSTINPAASPVQEAVSSNLRSVEFSRSNPVTADNPAWRRVKKSQWKQELEDQCENEFAGMPKLEKN